jgi:glycerol uptake facilitator-like aquaporin
MHIVVYLFLFLWLMMLCKFPIINNHFSMAHFSMVTYIDHMWTELFVEFLGTFIFLSVILSQGQAIPIGLALAAAIYFGGAISGGNFNPAVSLMMYLNGTLSLQSFLSYAVVQFLAGATALYFYRVASSPRRI